MSEKREGRQGPKSMQMLSRGTSGSFLMPIGRDGRWAISGFQRKLEQEVFEWFKDFQNKTGTLERDKGGR